MVVETNPQEAMKRLRDQVEKFLSVYRFMAPEERARFEAELQGHLKDKDERTQKLYWALMASARDNREVVDTIRSLEAVDGRKVYSGEESTEIGS